MQIAFARATRLTVLLACCNDTLAQTADDSAPQQFTVERGVRQLFLDDAGIERLIGLKKIVNQPRRHSRNPVVVGENAWEKASASVYGTAHFDTTLQLFRLWYLCTPGPPTPERKWVEVGGNRRVTNATLVGYAVSPDGMRWEKPLLEQLSFEGSKRNNLVDIGIDNPEGISVLYDPADRDASRRYKAFFWDRRVPPPDDSTGVPESLRSTPTEPQISETQRNGGMWVAASPDGVGWTTHGPVLAAHSDTTQSLVYDPTLKKYVAFGRFGFGRVVARTESDDFLHWSEPQPVLACDETDGPGGQIYGMPTDLYEGLYLGMFWMYREGGDARIDTQLAASRDGRGWQRVADRQTFLPNAAEGERDDGMSRCVGRFIVRGDTIYLYYSMVNGPHRSANFPMPVRRYPPAIGLVTLRRDGFVSLDCSAPDGEGTLLTRPFALPAGQLHLNASAGRITVSVCDASGNAMPGFELSRVIEQDGTRLPVEFTGTDLRQVVGNSVRLRFNLRNAKLFAYWFE